MESKKSAGSLELGALGESKKSAGSPLELEAGGAGGTAELGFGAVAGPVELVFGTIGGFLAFTWDQQTSNNEFQMSKSFCR